MSISYTRLKKIVDGIEQAVPPVSPIGFLAAVSVRRYLSQIQVCGLDKPDNSHSEEPLPVVIAIGANYTQGLNEAPRDYNPPYGTEEDLNKWRNLTDAGLKHYGTAPNQRTWYDASVASSNKIAIPKAYHFVMTNFCLWITENSWQDVRPSRRADLLANNPQAVSGKSTAPGSWWHLQELANALEENQVTTLWVGHGSDCEVFALFRQFVTTLSTPDWLLLPNVSRPYAYDNKRSRHLRPEL